MLASEVLNTFLPSGLITQLLGNDCAFDQVQPVETCQSTDLVFADDERYLPTLMEKKPAVVVTTEALSGALVEANVCVLVSSNVKLAHALVRQKYTDTDFWARDGVNVHARACVHSSVVVPSDCVIAAGVVIEANVEIASHVSIMANTVIQSGVTIGVDAVIHPNVVVGWGCQIGARVQLQSGCVIGPEGYGFAQDEARASHRIPQQGIVVIEDDVSIGAGTCIDRATFGETRIERGVKIDNLCHIAHNVLVGEDSLLTAQTVIAGSTTIGKRVITSGQTGILDHLTVADDVVLLHRAGVTQNIDSAGYYASLPLQPLRTYTKNAVVQKKLVDMNKKVRQLEKQLNALQTKLDE